MAVNAASKAGKSYTLIDLALCLSSGRPWIGLTTEQTRVLYLNFEIDRASFLHRVRSVADAEGITDLSGLDVLNLRGQSQDIEELTYRLEQAAQAGGYGAIIVDPLYSVFRSNRIRNFSENDAAAVAYILGELDRLSTRLGAAIIWAGHYSKGAQGHKAAIDRVSGSGVLGRFPDGILTFTETEADDVFQIDMILRDFARPEPFTVTWGYPIFERSPDRDGTPLKTINVERKKQTEASYQQSVKVLGDEPHGYGEAVQLLMSTGITTSRAKYLMTKFSDAGLIRKTTEGLWVRNGLV